jgi:tetratricopeptide (TPR) repeat protein/transcriptional regulator with XRE-family HTH domain
MAAGASAAYCGGTVGRGRVRGAGTVAGQPALTFAGLVRQLRAGAGLTQDELAQAAGLPVRTLSDLERGISRTAHKDTAGLLAGALGLAGPVAELFVAAARGKAAAGDVLATARQGAAPGAFAAVATRGLPRDIAAFTGRQAELARLLEALAAAARAGGGVVGIHAVDGMAGVGKTTFAVHVAHQLTGTFPDGQFFLPLHAHTPGQPPVGPADALGSLLLAAGVPATLLPPGLEARAARWRAWVAGKKILLVLDDAAGHEQVRPLLPGTADSLVLVTSRRRLTALEDATVISLDVLPPGEATALLARLAARTGLRPADTAAGEIARLCGYLPLAIGMIASQLRHHPTRTAGQVAAELATARDRLALMHAENLSVTAAFSLSYHDLTQDQQRLFRRLGLVPGPSLDAYAAAALGGTSLDAARRHLDELYDQHLITEPAAGRYRLHDLLRQHARTLAATDSSAESDAATGRLLNYYLHAAAAASQRIPTWTAAHDTQLPGDPPAHVPALSTLEQATGWLEAERGNLHAAATHAAATGRAVYAVQIPAAVGGFLRAQGHWDQAAALHRAAAAAARQAGDRHGQALALRQLGILGWMTGDLHAAIACLTSAADLYGEVGDQPGQAYTLDHLGVVYQLTGDYPAAVASRQQALTLARSSGDRLAEAVARTHLGWVQQLTGRLPEAAASLEQALTLARGLGHQLAEADVLSHLGRVQVATGDYPAAAASLQQSLALYRSLGHRPFQATALNSLGELATRTSAMRQARDHHAQALTIARDSGMSFEEARALEGIGHSYLHDGNPSHAARHLRQALAIYQRTDTPSAERVQQTLHQHQL